MADGGSVNSRDDLPRVSVDSVHDWQRISDNVSTAALAIFESRLQATGSSDKHDVLRPHIQQFLNRLLNISKPNLRINGRNFGEYGNDERDTELFDEALDRRVWSLSDQRLNWDFVIARKRRTVPSDVEDVIQDVIAKQREKDLTSVADDVIMDTDVEGDEALASPSAARIETSILMIGLRDALTEQLERVDRAKEVDDEIRALRV